MIGDGITVKAPCHQLLDDQDDYDGGNIILYRYCSKLVWLSTTGDQVIYICRVDFEHRGSPRSLFGVSQTLNTGGQRFLHRKHGVYNSQSSIEGQLSNLCRLKLSICIPEFDDCFVFRRRESICFDTVETSMCNIIFYWFGVLEMHRLRDDWILGVFWGAWI